ncbi:hypothetical protein H6F50_15625 [Coleofasciculus sp. FACHB-712]|uniref:hypothetical protein n=1 Tax=Coleofasciculus sp. FACHB-712 TaxID=2692789 RepID=UPI0016857761|nr:hypothetical protein [Coleofasciculus sp. FACHB-712]MBD1943769.1 hypothetical protein [Coleofasciculus sp. FACHB-712]
MTTIKISELKPAGYDLLSDSESYMNQLGNNELDSVSGGDKPFNDVGDYVGYGLLWTAGAMSVVSAVGLSFASPAAPGALIASGAGLATFAAASAAAYD